MQALKMCLNVDGMIELYVPTRKKHIDGRGGRRIDLRLKS